MGMVFTWLGLIDNTSLWRDVPRVCKRWAYLCQVQSHGVKLTYQIDVPQRTDITAVRASKIVARMKAAASRHCSPKEVTIRVTGHRNAIEIRRIVYAAADWITGLAINTDRFEYGEDTTVDVECVRAIVNLCPNLIRLGLVGMCSARLSREYVPYDSHDALLNELCSKLPRLRTLLLSHWMVSSKGMLHLAKCQELTSLNVGWRDMSSDSTLSKILNMCPELTIDNITTGSFGDHAIEADAYKMGHLKRKWKLGCTDRIGDGGRRFLLANCPNIVDITVHYTDAVGSHLLCALADSNLRLQKLRLHGRPRIGGHLVCFTEESVIKVLRTMRALVHVELVECGKLTHKTLIALAETCAPLLTTLKIFTRQSDGMRGSFVQLLERCHSLEHLELHEKDGQIGEIEFDALTRTCLRLKSLALDCSDQAEYPWTQYALDDLTQLHRLRQLRKLDIRRRTTNGPDTIGLLCAKCDWLTCIRLTGSAVQSETEVAVVVAKMVHLTELEVKSNNVWWSSTAGFDGCKAPLQKLTIKGGQTLRPAAATYILGKVHTLRRVEFGGCYRLEGSFLRKLAASFPNVYIVHPAYQALGMAVYEEDEGLGPPPHR
jgi:hypothetical protein